jgi:hypothetical protein
MSSPFSYTGMKPQATFPKEPGPVSREAGLAPSSQEWCFLHGHAGLSHTPAGCSACPILHSSWVLSEMQVWFLDGGLKTLGLSFHADLYTSHVRPFVTWCDPHDLDTSSCCTHTQAGLGVSGEHVRCVTGVFAVVWTCLMCGLCIVPISFDTSCVVCHSGINRHSTQICPKTSHPSRGITSPGLWQHPQCGVQCGDPAPLGFLKHSFAIL